MTIQKVQDLIKFSNKKINEFADIAVINLSGGVDSLVNTCLLVEALGAENVYTLHLPYGDLDAAKYNSNSMKIAKKLGVKFIYKSIGRSVDELCDINDCKTNDPDLIEGLSTLDKGNVRARVRMTEAYKWASHISRITGKRVRVFGTGNLSEDFIGYDTKFGDSAWDLCVTGELYKYEMYQLADYFVAKGMIDEDMVDRIPTAGLWEGQTDEGELGFNWDQISESIKKIIEYDNRGEWSHCDELVWDRHFKNKHKHMAPPILSLRKEFCGDGRFRSDIYQSDMQLFK